MRFLCQPVVLPFVIGYISHLILDLFNYSGEQIFFPLNKRICFERCYSGGVANTILFWSALGIDAVAGGFYFSQAIITARDSSVFVNRLLSLELIGLNSFQLYLIFINLITFLVFQRSWKLKDGKELANEEIVDFFTLLGGGIGMFLALIIHLHYPSKENCGKEWAFCYSSILFWFIIYCYVCNPFGHNKLMDICWLSFKHIPALLYLLAINIISALLVRSTYKQTRNNNRKYTLLLILGALGGTVGGFVGVVVTHKFGDFNYAVKGFPIMMISQIVFVMYMMALRIF